MIELYHSVNSVCAQKVRILLLEKEIEHREHLMKLGGDQFDPAYLHLNPNAVVPTLVHDGHPIVESSVILCYLDEAFPEPRMTPAPPTDRARMRMFLKLIDEYVHDSCTIVTFATAFRGNALRGTVAEFEAYLAKAPNQKRSQHRRDVIARGLDSQYVVEALGHYRKLLAWIDESAQASAYLAGEHYSLADIAVIPYILRLELLGLTRLWNGQKGVSRWYDRLRKRPAIDAAIFDRMSEADWAPFRALSPDPWPKVAEIMAEHPQSVRVPPTVVGTQQGMAVRSA